jgi:hypothetical protein
MRWCLMTSVRTADRQRDRIGLLNHDADALPVVNPEPVRSPGPVSLHWTDGPHTKGATGKRFEHRHSSRTVCLYATRTTMARA